MVNEDTVTVQTDDVVVQVVESQSVDANPAKVELPAVASSAADKNREALILPTVQELVPVVLLSVQQLGPHLLSMICEYLSDPELARTTRVCRNFRAV